MSAIPAPGTDRGPCGHQCSHLDCRNLRIMAQSECVYCRQKIGYGVPVARVLPPSPPRYRHAACAPPKIIEISAVRA